MLGLTALNGELFGPLACAELEQAACRNEDLLRALFHLSTFEDAPEGRGRAKRRGVRRRVNYEQALADPAIKAEAAEIIRSHIERITLTPNEEGTLDVHRTLMAWVRPYRRAFLAAERPCHT